MFCVTLGNAILSLIVIIVLITLWKIDSNVGNAINELLEICIFSFLIIEDQPVRFGREIHKPQK